MFMIIDRETDTRVGGTFVTYEGARGVADALDWSFGNYRHDVERVQRA